MNQWSTKRVSSLKALGQNLEFGSGGGGGVT